MRLVEIRTVKVCPVKIAPAEVRAAKGCLTKIRPAEIGQTGDRFDDERRSQVRASEICLAEISLEKLSPGEEFPAKFT